MNSPILIIGFSTESTIRHFTGYLADNATDYDIMDLSLVDKSARLGFEYTGNNLIVTINDREFDLQYWGAYYCRFYYKDTGDAALNEVFLKLIHALTSWLRQTHKKVVNRPGSGSSNYSKLAHLIDLGNCGFNIPASRIFGHTQTAQEKLGDFQNWISKGCSSYRTRVQTVDPGMYVNLDLLRYCPSQFQEKITGTNVRVHVVGKESIGLKINTPNIDYRYDTQHNRYELIDVPELIHRQCLLFCEKEELNFAGFDFVIDENGVWYVLEANPMPGFEFYDRRIDRKISKALAGFMSSPPLLSVVSCPADRPFIGNERRTKFN